MNFTAPDVNTMCLLPEILLLVFASVLLFVTSSPRRHTMVSFMAVAGILVQGVLIPLLWNKGYSGFHNVIVRDNLALLFQTVLLIAVLQAIVFSHYYLKTRGNHCAEYYALIFTSMLGMNVMITAHNLLVIFLGMEILSLSMYILVGFFRDIRESVEATLKYFLLGAFSSAIFLLGIAFYYGALGRIDFSMLGFACVATDAQSLLLLVGIALIFVGLGFKIASVPFHMWAPDTYEGAPVSIAALLSVAPKVAAFGVFLRICLAITDFRTDTVMVALVFMACTSIIAGNLAALRQTQLIRMLAYSGIAQVGYMLIGLLGVQNGGGASLVFYLIAYTFMNMGTFGIAVYISVREGRKLLIENLSGLASRHPVLALSMAIFMISLAGLPPTAGFFAKFYIFKTGIEAGYLWLVLVALIMTIVSLYYYFRVIMVMYMREAADQSLTGRREFSPLTVTIGILAFITLLLGIMPDNLVTVITRTISLM